jgi:hypothetical protein
MGPDGWRQDRRPDDPQLVAIADGIREQRFLVPVKL